MITKKMSGYQKLKQEIKSLQKLLHKLYTKQELTPVESLYLTMYGYTFDNKLILPGRKKHDTTI